jgi:hypothetical protein
MSETAKNLTTEVLAVLEVGNMNLEDNLSSMTLDERLNVLSANTDAFFLITIGIFIFFMQGGFAFLEAGAVR